MNRTPGQSRKAPGTAGKVDARGLSTPTYYRYRAIKEPTWGWEIIAYFFLGGIASGSYLVATLADLLGTAEDRQVSRSGRYLAFGSVLVSPLLLIADLGRPERFPNMLRIVKTRSPMSMGTWGLSGLGLFSALGVLRQAHEDGLVNNKSWLGKLLTSTPLAVSGVLGTLFAFFVGSYTGVLLSFTNVPLWAKNSLVQGPLFLTSALSTGLSAISTVLAIKGNVSPKTEAWMGAAKNVAAVGEMGLMAGTLATLGPRSRPLVRRPYGMPFWLGVVGLGFIAPLVLRANARREASSGARARNVAADLCVLMGGVMFRWLTVRAGQESARQPEEYLEFAQTKGSRKGVRRL